MARLAPPLAAVLLATAFLVAGCGSSAAGVAAPPTAKRTFAGAGLNPPRSAPAIALHDASGTAVTLAGQRGRYVLVTFLYTHCPDVCPLIASNLNAAVRALGAKRTDVRVLAVSVDPKGDTPGAVRAFAKRMHLVSEFRFLIGSAPELRRVWAAWHVLSVKQSPGVVDHVAYTALVDPAGEERVLYGSDVHARDVVHDLRTLMRRAGSTSTRA